MTGPRARRSGGGGLGLELRTNQPSQDLRPHGQKFLQKQIGGKKHKQKQYVKRETEKDDAKHIQKLVVIKNLQNFPEKGQELKLVDLGNTVYRRIIMCLVVLKNI